MPRSRKKEFVDLEFHECLTAVRGLRIKLSRDFIEKNVAPPTPQELNEIYNRGFQGVKKNTRQGKKKFKEMMAAMPTLYEVYPWAKGLGKGKLLCPYVAMLKLMPSWGGDDAQSRGDCTVHGTAHAAAIDYGIDALYSETKFMGPLACENIYRSRGFNSDGWSCEAPCVYVGPNGDGGLLYRQVWKDPAGSASVDLSKYNPSWEGNGSAGTPSWMEKLSQQNKVKWVIPIPTPDVYFDALAMGFGINVCSGQGFSSTTDEFGVSNAQGSWSHSMGHTGADNRPTTCTKYGGDGIGGIQQSWGPWNTQNGRPDGSPPMPIGMFYAKMSVIARNMLGDDSFALCGVWGWNRTSWEAFNITDYKIDLVKALNDSTTKDRYVERAAWLAELTQRAVDENNFLGV